MLLRVGQHKCYSLDNEKTVFIKYYVPDGTIDDFIARLYEGRRRGVWKVC